MNLAANEPAPAIKGIEAIAFCQKMFERAWLRGKNRTNRTVVRLQFCRGRSGVASLAGVFDPAMLFGTTHPRAEVRQMEPRTGDRDGQRVPGVEAEKPNPWLVSGLHISANIQLRK